MSKKIQYFPNTFFASDFDHNVFEKTSKRFAHFMLISFFGLADPFENVLFSFFCMEIVNQSVRFR